MCSYTYMIRFVRMSCYMYSSTSGKGTESAMSAQRSGRLPGFLTATMQGVSCRPTEFSAQHCSAPILLLERNSVMLSRGTVNSTLDAEPSELMCDGMTRRVYELVTHTHEKEMESSGEALTRHRAVTVLPGSAHTSLASAHTGASAGGDRDGDTHSRKITFSKYTNRTHVPHHAHNYCIYLQRTVIFTGGLTPVPSELVALQ